MVLAASGLLEPTSALKERRLHLIGKGSREMGKSMK